MSRLAAALSGGPVSWLKPGSASSRSTPPINIAINPASAMARPNSRHIQT